MKTTQINGITLTEEAINLIRKIQEEENGWISRSLETAIDFVLEFDSQKPTDKERLEWRKYARQTLTRWKTARVCLY